MLLVVFAAGLHRRLRAVLPDSTLPTLALRGLIGTAFVSIMGSGLDTEFMMGIPNEDASRTPTRRCTTTGSAPSRGCGPSPASPALALFVAHRRGGVPRWIGLVGLVLGGLTLLLGVSPLQYMAGMTGPLWLLVTALGFAFGDKAYPGRPCVSAPGHVPSTARRSALDGSGRRAGADDVPAEPPRE